MWIFKDVKRLVLLTASKGCVYLQGINEVRSL